jgi:hypothetical protein
VGGASFPLEVVARGGDFLRESGRLFFVNSGFSKSLQRVVGASVISCAKAPTRSLVESIDGGFDD